MLLKEIGKLVCGCFIYFSRHDNQLKLIENIYVIKDGLLASTDLEYKIQNTERAVGIAIDNLVIYYY